GAMELVDETMANAARVHAAELGKDLVRHCIVAFGGAAPLHAARVAEKIGVSRVVVPRAAGVGSAIGFLRAPMAYDVVISRPVRLDSYDTGIVAAALDDMGRRAGEAARGLAGVGDLTMTRTVDMRYVGQGSEVSVPIGDGLPTAHELRTRFEERYQALFGRVIPHAPIEVLSWQVRISRETWRGDRHETSPVAAPTRAVAVGARNVFDIHRGHFVPYLIYERDGLAPGTVLRGPVLVIEDETTTVVPARFSVRVGAVGHLILNRDPSEEA